MDDRTKYSQFDIYLPDFWIRIKRFWYRYLILTILFAALFAFYKANQEYKMSITEELSAEDRIANIEYQVDQMNSFDRTNFQAYLRIYDYYCRRKEYLNDSILMGIDYSNVYRANIFFTDSSLQLRTDEIFVSSSNVFSEDEIDEINKMIGKNFNKNDIYDLIYISYLDDMVRVSIFSENRDDMNSLAMAVKTIIDKRYGSSTISYESGFSKDLALIQEKQVDSLAPLASSLTVAASGLTDKQKEIANEYYMLKKIENVDNSVASLKTRRVYTFVDKKFILIGGFAGIFISLFYDAIFLLFGAIVYNKYSVETFLKADTIAEIKSVDDFEFEMFIKSMEKRVSHSPNRNLMVISNIREEDNNIINKMKEKVKDSFVKYSFTSIYEMNSEKIDLLEKNEELVYMIDINHCKKKDLIEMNRIANRFLYNIHGTIILK